MPLSLHTLARGVQRTAQNIPLLRRLRELEYGRRFAGSWPGTYQGVYGSFAEAREAAPKSMKTGYDQPELAKMYRDRMSRAMPSDYPVLFWLTKLVEPGVRIFDYGGHVGVSFHCFEHYLTYPEDLRWTVLDVPAVVREGEALARERGKAGQLSFTTHFEDADGVDVLLAAGSLQYIDEPLWTSLARLTTLPRHLLLTKTPLYEGETFVTIQNTGNAFHPYRVWNRDEFVRAIERCGYSVRDEWTNGEQSCRVPFHDGKTIHAYTGLLFDRLD